MRLWAVPTFLLLASVAFGGCLDGDDDAEIQEEVPDVEVLDDPGLDDRTVVHRADGLRLLDEAYAGGLPVLEQHYVGGPLEEAGEPTVGVTPGGTGFYVSLGPGFKPDVWRSRDHGAAWEKVTPEVAPLLGYPPASNDPFVYADPLTGRVFSVDLDLTINCSTVQWSDDEGDTWARSTTAQCVDPIEGQSHDHQSLATGVPHGTATDGYPNIVHYCVNRGEAFCFRSLDGGASWLGPVATGLELCGGLTGHVVTGPNGDAYVAQVSCNGEPDEEDLVQIAVSRDDGETWTKHVVSNGTVPVAKEHTSSHEASVAVDAAGNVYLMFMDERTLPRLTVSRDGGVTWSEPRDIARPGLTGALLPSLVAGDAGRIAWLYIGTTSPGGHDSATAATTWNAYVGTSLDADSPDPTFATTTANDLSDPLKRGACTGRCQGAGMGIIPGGMYDFLDITIDPVTGRLWTALVDVCNDACSGAEGSDDGRQIGRPAVGVQVGGTTLRQGTTLS